MPVVGRDQIVQRSNKGYMKDPLYQLCKEYAEVARNILDESHVDVFTESEKVMGRASANLALKDFFIENSADPNSFDDPEQYEDHMAMMEAYFDNDRKAIINEYTAMANVNPVMGTTLPLHKNLLMNNVFTQTDAIPKAVAAAPKWTESMEYRYLYTPDGKEIDFYTQQYMLTDAIDATAPYKEFVLGLPEIGKTDILEKIGASSNDHLSIDVRVTAIAVPVTAVEEGQTEATSEELTPAGVTVGTDKFIWLPVNIPFNPAYGMNDQRSLLAKLTPALTVKNLKAADDDHKDDILQGTMLDDKLTLFATKGLVKAVKVKARKDTSNAMLETCSVGWKHDTIVYEIPNAIPINVTFSPEEIKDYAALYDVNQLTKVMSMLKIVIGNYKDDKILDFLNESYKNLPKTQSNYAAFDWAPRHNYALDHVEWRHKTFFDNLDSFVTPLLNVLNDPNMTVTFFGRPDIIRKITPTEYKYESPKNVGAIPLEFKKGVWTSDDRTYQFISSQKFESQMLGGQNHRALGDQIICILSPKNTDRIIYKIYDYQLYISNEIRNAKVYTLPAVHIFERWLPTEYQPVQGRIEILNPTGQRENDAVKVAVQGEVTTKAGA